VGRNTENPSTWPADIAQSVAAYNAWYEDFAPSAFRRTRESVTPEVADALERTANLTDVTAGLLRRHPSVTPILRMATAPPIARDRLAGLAGVPPGYVGTLEGDRTNGIPGRIPRKPTGAVADQYLERIGAVIERLADKDLCPWLKTQTTPSDADVMGVAGIIADRYTASIADPLIRNEQERRQFRAVRAMLSPEAGYTELPSGSGIRYDQFRPGNFGFHINVFAELEGGRQVKMPMDAVIMPLGAQKGDLPLFIEAKSAGDFTNVNKRRKEEVTKMTQLRRTFAGRSFTFVLLLAGYFDQGYLSYSATDDFQWVWQHRLADLQEFLH